MTQAARDTARAVNRALGLAIAGACALVSAMAIGRFAYTPLLPYLQRDLGLGIGAAGYIASANFLGYLAGALAAMRIDAAHRQAWFAAALLASVATTLAMAFAASPWTMAAIRALAGVASAFVLIQGSAIALDALARLRRPELFVLPYSGVGIGIAASAAIVEVLIRMDADARTLWLVMAAAAAATAIPALALRDPAHAGADGDEGQAPRREGRDSTDATPAREQGARSHPTQAAPPTQSAHALRWLTLAYGCLGFGYVITMTFVVVIVRGRADWRPYEMLVWTCVGLAGAPSNWLWGLVARRSDPWRAMTIAFLLEAVGVVAAISESRLALVAAGGILVGGTFLGITALGLATGRRLAVGDSGRTVARMTAAFGLGQILGPAAGAWIAERTGSFAGPSVLAAATLVAAAAMVERSRTLQARQVTSRPGARGSGPDTASGG